MNEEDMMKKAMRPIEKNRRTRSKPAKIRHLQKQQKLWMVSKMEWRKPGTKSGLAPSSLSPFSFVRPQHRSLTTIWWDCCAA
ncbi:MAG: hypothetical protein ACYDHF_01830 [Candidatus Cryosericum sp.]